MARPGKRKHAWPRGCSVTVLCAALDQRSHELPAFLACALNEVKNNEVKTRVSGRYVGSKGSARCLVAFDVRGEVPGSTQRGEICEEVVDLPRECVLVDDADAENECEVVELLDYSVGHRGALLQRPRIGARYSCTFFSDATSQQQTLRCEVVEFCTKKKTLHGKRANYVGLRFTAGGTVYHFDRDGSQQRPLRFTALAAGQDLDNDPVHVDTALEIEQANEALRKKALREVSSCPAKEQTPTGCRRFEPRLVGAQTTCTLLFETGAVEGVSCEVVEDANGEAVLKFPAPTTSRADFFSAAPLRARFQDSDGEPASLLEAHVNLAPNSRFTMKKLSRHLQMLHAGNVVCFRRIPSRAYTEPRQVTFLRSMGVQTAELVEELKNKSSWRIKIEFEGCPDNHILYDVPTAILTKYARLSTIKWRKPRPRPQVDSFVNILRFSNHDLVGRVHSWHPSEPSLGDTWIVDIWKDDCVWDVKTKDLMVIAPRPEDVQDVAEPAIDLTYY